MSAFSSQWAILEGMIANAYGVDEIGPIYYTDFHWHQSSPEPRVSTIVLPTSKDHLCLSRAARSAFKALCADEISVPVFDLKPGSKLAPFFALEPSLAP